jgi:hypothetical protein
MFKACELSDIEAGSYFALSYLEIENIAIRVYSVPEWDGICIRFNSGLTVKIPPCSAVLPLETALDPYHGIQYRVIPDLSQVPYIGREPAPMENDE